MADVFAFYDCSEGAPPGQAAMVTLWERGWRNRGWSPRLITARHARRSKLYVKYKGARGFADVPAISLLALHAVGGGIMTPLNMINFDFPVSTVRPSFGLFGCGMVRVSRSALENFFQSGKHSAAEVVWCARYGEARWLNAPLVYFDTPKESVSCGRPF